jgi:hypothetical protein
MSARDSLTVQITGNRIKSKPSEPIAYVLRNWRDRIAAIPRMQQQRQERDNRINKTKTKIIKEKEM